MLEFFSNSENQTKWEIHNTYVLRLWYYNMLIPWQELGLNSAIILCFSSLFSQHRSRGIIVSVARTCFFHLLHCTSKMTFLSEVHTTLSLVLPCHVHFQLRFPWDLGENLWQNFIKYKHLLVATTKQMSSNFTNYIVELWFPFSSYISTKNVYFPPGEEIASFLSNSDEVGSKWEKSSVATANRVSDQMRGINNTRERWRFK